MSVRAETPKELAARAREIAEDVVHAADTPWGIQPMNVVSLATAIEALAKAVEEMSWSA